MYNINLKSLEFKLTPEQMKRLGDVSEPSEVPFPFRFFDMVDLNLRKNINVPARFESLAAKYDFGTSRSLLYKDS
ncbi:unnamed protein product [Rhizophagus irregularis]|nr:unnamed protein product [Rhizophagus irregularis]